MAIQQRQRAGARQKIANLIEIAKRWSPSPDMRVASASRPSVSKTRPLVLTSDRQRTRMRPRKRSRKP
jgi:hypothetical protein